MTPEMVGIINLIVLTLTLIVLCVYAYDTRRIANQTIDVALRPLILRRGWITSWNEIPTVENFMKSGITKTTKLLEFQNQKNIAVDIKGFIIIDNNKYNFIFGNEVTQKQDVLAMLPKWGWLPPNASLYATFEKKSSVRSSEKNQIYLTYKDTEGNSYFTKENEEFLQTTEKL